MISYEPLLEIGLGPLSVTPHGVFTALGLAAGTAVALPHFRRRGVSNEQVYEVMTPAVLAALVAARLVYVLNHMDTYDSVLDVIRIWEGGASLLGGLAGALIVVVIMLRRRRMPILRLLDPVGLGFAVGIAVGRIGDLLIADHLGKPTDFALGYACPGGETGSPCVAPVGQAVHLTALYDMALAAGVAIILLWLLRRGDRRQNPPGSVFITFFVLYGTGRFLEGFARVDETHGTGLDGSQWASLVSLLVAGAFLVWRRRSSPQHAGAGGSAGPVAEGGSQSRPPEVRP
ncbi:MAG: prolipoprotein diacylglyceryl transferase [Actinomycetota bacterium]|nr:prolipoprotein diacylglyceryl transferase [Actinomycetota bacterium]